MVAGPPSSEPPVPAPVAAIAGGWTVRVVWANELGGLTYEVAGVGGRRFVKWGPSPHEPLLEAEVARLRWAARFTPVPQVVEVGHDDAGCWLVTEGLVGDNAVAPRWRSEPAVAVHAIGEGLRALHDALPVEACPFSWSAAARVADARSRAQAGEIDPERCMLVGTSTSLDDALATVASPPPVDHLVVCHGDACAPNTLIGDDGTWSGHVDLGSMGVADRWADLAVATWSLDWNYGPGWEATLLDAYGVYPDPGRTAYYRLLWDLGP